MILFKDKKAIYKNRTRSVDVTKELELYLFEPVSFDKNFTVKDLFLILIKNKSLMRTYDYYDAKVFIKEGLERRSRKSISKSSKIEFYWHSDPFEKTLDVEKPKVHGLNGRGKPFGLDFLPASEIRHCRIVVNTSLWINTEIRGETYRIETPKLTPTVGQIIQGLIWELSYWGHPTKRDAQSKPSEEELTHLEEGALEVDPNMPREDLGDFLERLINETPRRRPRRQE